MRHNGESDGEFPVVEIGTVEQSRAEEQIRFTKEEIEAVGSPIIFEKLFGKAWFRWFLIIGISAVTTSLLILGLWASTSAVTDTLAIYCQKRFVPGKRHGFRIAVIDDEKGFVPLKAVEVKVVRDHPRTEAILFSGGLRPHLASSMVLAIPSWREGKYTMVVDAQIDRKSKRAEFNIQLDPSFKGSDLKRNVDGSDLGQGASFIDTVSGIKVEIIPEEPAVASALHNILFVRTTSVKGEPVSTSVGVKLLDGYVGSKIPPVVETDEAGLGSFMVYPTFNYLVLGVSLPDIDGSGEGRINIHASAKTIKIRARNPVPVSGTKVAVMVYSINRMSDFYLDLYREGLWQYAHSGFIASFKSALELPVGDQSGLITVQGYTSPAFVGRAISSTMLLVRSRGDSLLCAIRRLCTEMIKRGIDVEYARWIRGEKLDGVNKMRLASFLLTRIGGGGYYEPEVFYTTRKLEEERVSKFKSVVKKIVVVSLSAAACLFSVIVIFIFIFAIRRKSILSRKAVTTEEIIDWRGQRVVVEVGERQDEEHLFSTTGADAGGGMGTGRFYIQVALLAAVVALLFALFALFFKILKWNFQV